MHAHTRNAPAMPCTATTENFSCYDAAGEATRHDLVDCSGAMMRMHATDGTHMLLNLQLLLSHLFTLIVYCLSRTFFFTDWRKMRGTDSAVGACGASPPRQATSEMRGLLIETGVPRSLAALCEIWQFGARNQWTLGSCFGPSQLNEFMPSDTSRWEPRALGLRQCTGSTAVPVPVGHGTGRKF